jgi:hypothetical protein
VIVDGHSQSGRRCSRRAFSAKIVELDFLTDPERIAELDLTVTTTAVRRPTGCRSSSSCLER